MTLYNITNPTAAPRVIHTKVANPPQKQDEKTGKMIDDPARSHTEIRIEAGATKENVELDDGLVQRLKDQADKEAKIGPNRELVITPVHRPASKAA